MLRLVGDYVEHHGVGTATFAPFDVVYSPADVLEPDLVVLPAPVATLGKNWNGTSIPPMVVVARPGERDVTHTVELVWRPVRGTKALRINIDALFAGLPPAE